MTNDVRINNLSPSFHKKIAEESRPLLRLTAKFKDENLSVDPLVIYFDPEATMAFDKEKDALKLMNTDNTVPNFFAISSDNRQLSINAIPEPDRITTFIPLGIKTESDGWIIFNAKSVLNMPFGLNIYFVDSINGLHQNLTLDPECRIHLISGEYINRFYILFSDHDLRFKPAPEDIFHVYSAGNRIFAYCNVATGEAVGLSIHDMLSREVYKIELEGNGYHELNVNVITGLYLISLKASEGMLTKKLMLINE
jgi:hypothetical protein